MTTPTDRLREAAQAVLATASHTNFTGLCKHAEAMASLRAALADLALLKREYEAQTTRFAYCNQERIALRAKRPAVVMPKSFPVGMTGSRSITINVFDSDEMLAALHAAGVETREA